MSENNTPLDGLDPVQAALKRAVSRRTCFAGRRDRRSGSVDGASSRPATSAATTTRRPGTTTAAASQSNLNFYWSRTASPGTCSGRSTGTGSVTAQKYGVKVTDLPLEQFSVAGTSIC